MDKKPIIVGLLVAFLPISSPCEIFKCEAEDGVVTFSEKPCGKMSGSVYVDDSSGLSSSDSSRKYRINQRSQQRSDGSSNSYSETESRIYIDIPDMPKPPEPGPIPSITRFVPIEPCRIMDTRQVGGVFGGGIVRNYQVRGDGLDTQGGSFDCGVPVNVTATQLNFTAVDPSGFGYLRAWPYGVPEPTATLMAYDEASVSNSVAVPICNYCVNDFSVKLYGATTHLVVEVVGYYVEPPMCLTGNDCTDGNVCTSDTCDPILGCSNTPTPGIACDSDSNGCTIDDSCNAEGQCTVGTAVTCSDGLACTTDLCNSTGANTFDCTNEIQSDKCLIEGVCYASGSINPLNDGESCQPEISQTNWTPNQECSIDGVFCNDHADCCNGNCNSDSICGAEGCLIADEACVDGSECCTGNCADGFCAAAG